MVMLYTCGNCQTGDHEKCEGSHPAPRGQFGGRKCICGCMGRSQGQWDADWDDAMRERIKNAWKMEEGNR